MLALALQGLFTLIASALMIMLLQPEWYLIIGMFTALAAIAAFIYNKIVLIDEEPTFGWLAVTVLVVLCIGLFWPVVPCATAYGALVDRDEHPRGRSRGR